MAIVKWYWQFGDGGVSTDQNPVHTYPMPGSYTWRLEVTDSLGNTAYTTGTVTVKLGDDIEMLLSNVSYRYGLKRAQGIGLSENTGNRWPICAEGVPPVEAVNANKYRQSLAFDNRRGIWYDITTRDCPESSNLYKAVADAEGPVCIITNIVLGGPSDGFIATVTAAGHRATTGDFVHIEEVGGTTELNGINWEVTYVNANSFTIKPVGDYAHGSDLTTWTSGGVCWRKGTDFEPAAQFPEDSGTFEHYWLSHLESHMFIRPEDSFNRGQPGFTVEGLPDGSEFNVEIYADGEQVTKTAQVEDIPLSGDLAFDKPITAHRLHYIIRGNKGGHAVIGRLHYYLAEDTPEAPSRDNLSWQAYQAELALPLLRIQAKRLAVRNLVTGAAVGAITSYLPQTGPDGNTTAFRVPAGTTILGAVAALTTGTMLFWTNNASFTLQLNGVAVSPTLVKTIGTWRGYKVTGISSTAGNLRAVLAGAVDFADILVYSTALSADCITYYFSDVEDNYGKAVMP